MIRLLRHILALAPLWVALGAAAEAPPAMPRDGSHDFDWEIGTWKTHLKLLRRPLSGSTEWVEYDGTSLVRGVLGNRANIVELDVQGPAGRIQGAALRLYEPRARRWTLNFFNVNDGLLTSPMTGEIHDGTGIFFGPDTFRDKPIRVRFVISKVTADSYRFEQAFSTDSGKTWEINWIATDTRA
jgi:hypothetical protein